MDETKILDIISKNGFAVIIAGLVIWLVYKNAPKVFDLWVAREKAQQEYYAKRQAQYDEQMGILTKVVAQNTAIIERNNAIVSQATSSNERIAAFMDSEIKEIAALRNEIKNINLLQTRKKSEKIS